jgi:hypothetical protein
MKRPLLVLAAILAFGCQTPDASPSAAAPTADAATGPNPPPGTAVRFDDAILADNGTTLTLRFIGGKEYDASDPCSNHYFAWAREDRGTLDAKIVDDTPPFGQPPETPMACPAIGYSRTITFELAGPFRGARIHDLAGYDHFVRRPLGAANLTIPAGWKPLDEGDVEESPTGRWRQSWTNGEVGEANKGRIDLYQAFGGPANVSGGAEQRQVEVNGGAATLYRAPDVGELVLVWTLGDDGLALVVNEADFPIDAAIALAETVTLP